MASTAGKKASKQMERIVEDAGIVDTFVAVDDKSAPGSVGEAEGLTEVSAKLSSRPAKLMYDLPDVTLMSPRCKNQRCFLFTRGFMDMRIEFRCP